MQRITMKFGGTSVGSADAIRQVMDILRTRFESGSQVIAVVSAMAGVTDLLTTAAQAAAEGRRGVWQETARELRQRHAEVLQALVTEGAQREIAQREVDVIAADLTDSRLELSKSIGADHTLNPEDTDFSERLVGATMGKGPAVVIEATGHPDAISTALAVAGWGARIVLLASTRGETPSVNFYRDVHKKGLILYGAHNSIRPRQESSPNFWTSEDDSRLMLSLIAQRRFIVAPMISHRVPGHDAPKAYQLLMKWNPGLLGVVLQWNKDM